MDTHPWARASKTKEASNLERPVPPYSALVYTAPNPRAAAALRVSTGKTSPWSQAAMLGKSSFMAKVLARAWISLCSSVRPEAMSKLVTKAGLLASPHSAASEEVDCSRREGRHLLFSEDKNIEIFEKD